MAITKHQKADILKRLRQEVLKAPTIVFVNFHGLSVAEAAKLRRSLRERAVKFLVAKKTLVKKALAEAGLTGQAPDLPGELAVAYGDDLLISSKGVYEYERQTGGLVKILGGVIDGAYASQETVLALAQIPSREVLLSQFLYLIRSPVQGLAIALNEIAKQQA